MGSVVAVIGGAMCALGKDGKVWCVPKSGITHVSEMLPLTDPTGDVISGVVDVDMNPKVICVAMGSKEVLGGVRRGLLPP